MIKRNRLQNFWLLFTIANWSTSSLRKSLFFSSKDMFIFIKNDTSFLHLTPTLFVFFRNSDGRVQSCWLEGNGMLALLVPVGNYVLYSYKIFQDNKK